MAYICKQNLTAMNCTTCDQVSNCQHQTGAVPGFPLRSFLCSQSAIIQKLILPNLATYWIWKVEKKQNPSSFLATYWNLSLKSGDLEKHSLKSDEFTSKRKCWVVQSNWKLLSSCSAVVEEWLTEDMWSDSQRDMWCITSGNCRWK
jgi:hypothetical protein